MTSTTLYAKDADGLPRPIAFVDASGTGDGPYVPAHVPAPGGPVDRSVNPMSVGGLNILREIAPASRLGWVVQNQSARDLVVALDDGAGGNLTRFVLPAADTPGRAGGRIGAPEAGLHQGRITIYGPPGSPVAIRTW